MSSRCLSSPLLLPIRHGPLYWSNFHSPRSNDCLHAALTLATDQYATVGNQAAHGHSRHFLRCLIGDTRRYTSDQKVVLHGDPARHHIHQHLSTARHPGRNATHGHTGILVDLPELRVRSDDSLLRHLWGGKKCCGRSSRRGQHGASAEALVRWPYARQLEHTCIAPGTAHWRLDSWHARGLPRAPVTVPLDQRSLLFRSIGERARYSELAVAIAPLGRFDRLGHDTIVCATSAAYRGVERCLRANLQCARSGTCQVACDRDGARSCDSAERAAARSARTLQEFANVLYALFCIHVDLVVCAVPDARYRFAFYSAERGAGTMA